MRKEDDRSEPARLGVAVVGQAGSKPDLTCLSVPGRPACASESPLPDCPQKPTPAESVSQDYFSSPLTVELPPLDYMQTVMTVESAPNDYRWSVIPGNMPRTIIFQSRFHGASFCGLSAASDSWESVPPDHFSGLTRKNHKLALLGRRRAWGGGGRRGKSAFYQTS